jgi:hypothetical protein
MGNFVEVFFGKGKTPTEVLAEIADGARKAERVMTREAKRARLEGRKAFVEVQNLLTDSGGTFEMIERDMAALYLIAEQSQDRADRYFAQASVLRDFTTTIKVMSSNVDMLKAQLRASSLMSRLIRLLPNSVELMQLAKRLELSKLQQEQIRETLGDGMKEFGEDLYEDAGGDVAGRRESPQERVKKRMAVHRIEAGLEAEDADELLANAPKVPHSPRGRAAPVGLSVSAPPPAPPPNHHDGDSSDE